MSKRIIRFVTTIAFVLSLSTTYAQETAGSSTSTSTAKTQKTTKTAVKPAAPVDNTLHGKYKYMSKRGGRWKEYRMIKQEWLNDYWSIVDDSLQTAYKDAAAARLETDQAQQEVKEMEARLGEKDRLIELGDYIQLMGMDMPKYSVLYTAFTVIAVLVIVLIVFLIRFQANNQAVITIKKDHDSIESEYEEFRTRAQEREMQVRRELVTERNKGEELKKELSVLRKRENKLS
ncbi:hypothetical protein [Flammeovirga kamogawensis]|uniref:Uncharacterized protein n=1 Tax=Flammeovirga kamogawensis TaxID=373891 RepID=A0ABX8GT20_9BACT|nr:hypothetical protein [Flammeovirga kamogawensis]MBB6461408.1 cell division protein FtsL [Flammeovirga kamogawensis]QWG06307.1 hypothetical protein KM029_13305 [Flammeovirga kamogawensis]TRX68136.1 hypothetical protein EO216_08320 [Flammeovirga kamogawensis]